MSVQSIGFCLLGSHLLFNHSVILILVKVGANVDTSPENTSGQVPSLALVTMSPFALRNRRRLHAGCPSFEWITCVKSSCAINLNMFERAVGFGGQFRTTNLISVTACK